MNTFSRNKTMAALLLAAATVGLPTTSFADPAKSSYRYQDCKEADREGQLIGGLVGAVAGGAAGREIAGRRDRTEGAAIGAVVGAVAGAAIANKDCDDRNYRRTYSRQNTSRTYGTNYGYNDRYYDNNRYNRGTTYSSNQRGVARGNPHVQGHRIHGSRWGYSNRSRNWNRRDTLKQRIQWEISELRREREYLIDKRRYRRYDRDLDRRVYQIGVELDHLKKELKYVKKGRSYRDYDRIRYRWSDRNYQRNYGYNNTYYKSKR